MIRLIWIEVAEFGRGSQASDPLQPHRHDRWKLTRVWL